ncbi:MAG TPA: tyrosinase family protein [Candidatus Angelobacter sp.]|nr:tyrosinase family protein [Candidatus Angelobacter sp.]
MNNRFTRRRFLATAGVAGATVLGSSIFNLESVWAAPVMRRNLGGMAASDPVLVSYRKAIKAMKALPTSNPLSWNYQAAIHRTTLPGSYTAWNTCEHGTHLFWCWHRMYLYWFERIVRKMSGDPGWALPYWDYHNASQRTLPAPFRDPTSELYVADPNRGSGWNSGSASFPASYVDPSAGMADLDYFSAQTDIEQVPHNVVHGALGGWMGSVPTAAQDPVFYVHHSNIDRYWNLWLAQGGGRHDPLSDATWKNHTSTFFDETGKAVHMTCCDVLRCAEQLNYTYEGEPPEVKEYCLRIIFPWWWLVVQVLIHWPGPPVELGEREVTVPIDIAQLRERIPALLQSKNERLVIELDNVVADRAPGVVWEVYLGAPPNTPLTSESPHFLGVMTLFAAGVREHAHGEFKPEHFTFRANRALEASLRTKQEKLPLVFVPTGPLIDGKPSHPKVQSPVRIGAINVAIARQEERKDNPIVPERPPQEPKQPK